MSSQVRSLLSDFHKKQNPKILQHRALRGRLLGLFDWAFPPAFGCVGWAECTVAGPGRVRRHAAQFSERSSTPLIGHARVALSGVLTGFPQRKRMIHSGEDEALLSNQWADLAPALEYPNPKLGRTLRHTACPSCI